MTPPPTSWQSALTSAHRAILAGQQQFREAARSIAAGVRDLQQGSPGAPQQLAGDLVELSTAARTIRAGAAIVRTDREVGNEILNMVRHDEAAREARDTRPRPGKRPRPKIDLYA